MLHNHYLPAEGLATFSILYNCKFRTSSSYSKQVGFCSKKEHTPSRLSKYSVLQKAVAQLSVGVPGEVAWSVHLLISQSNSMALCL